mmetsp:Transcript_50265/g.116691  ORF Transcript_50265/g.116691 Transcript_50265/m.116691 type:complete len:219 (-) Transcript_50265:236-892(-)|eukprot:CAMPEP_0171058006 /NCGR_PEP_ID=MMETSP0766_2-20121228/2192_1 /TAXON_ID=439317 /ORGANISM="Gambierdiscus australes, Strain CAWD 149" /LENGTH=218 /DNA_ID=CAMNT_0011513219 /DNA_START=69 /DNA_END=725 /DNA_ORIENTATION=-
MPIVMAREATADLKPGQKMSPEAELLAVCGWGKCTRRLDRVLKKKINVNCKNDDGMTPLHCAASCGSAEFCKKLIDAKADPNIPATSMLVTPLELVLTRISYDEERDTRLNDFDQVNRLDDTALAVRPDLKPYHETKKVLEDNGAVVADAFGDDPIIKPNGSIKGGPASELRSYDAGADGSYTVAAHLRTGKYDILKYEDGRLVEAEFDAMSGRWESM